MLSTIEKSLLLRSAVGRFYSSSYSTERKFKNFNPRHKQQQIETIKPGKIKHPQISAREAWKRDQEKEREILERFKEESRRNLAEYGDIIEEPNVNNISKAYEMFKKDRDQFRDRLKRSRMTRKHFKDIMPKETNLLTWAEKENIRYLMETDPGQWSPEAISQAYPISPEGVQKVVKSGLKLRTQKEVIKHDQFVVDKIRRIKSGEIPMTDELEKRLQIRDLTPIKIGDMGVNPNQFLDVKPKTDGEFASLVAPPASSKQKDNSYNQDPSVKYISDGSFYYNEGEMQEKLQPGLSQSELRNILHSPAKRMTFAEFERKMDQSNADNLASDMKYMLSINNSQENRRTKYEEYSPEEPTQSREEFSNVPQNIPKYKAQDEDSVITLTVEGKENFVYSPEIGYEKPYEPSDLSIREKINIPERLRKAGATYKVGNSYYDDEGNFILRVI